MRLKLLLLAGFAALLVCTSEGLAQPGGPGDSRGSPNSRGGGRGSPGGGGPRGSFGGGSQGGGPQGGSLFGGGDPSQFFNQMTNGKDVWLRTEADPRMQRMFDRIAAQVGATNGQITRQQFTAYQEQRTAERASGRGGPGSSPDSGGMRGRGGMPTPTPEGMFLFLDKNGDGYLNYDEMPDELRVERDRWDADRNGLIDLNEFRVFFQTRVQPPQTDGTTPDAQTLANLLYYNLEATTPAEDERKPPVVYRPGKLPKELPSWFSQYDTDQDGQIGLYEWRASGKSLQEFDEIDHNRDGFLTVDEVLRYVKANGGPSPGGPQFGSGQFGSGQFSPGQFGGGQFADRGQGQYGPGNWDNGGGSSRNFGRGGGGPPSGGRDRGSPRGGRSNGRGRGGPDREYYNY
jgi:hypothetical protein